jgi:hypothetical protein
LCVARSRMNEQNQNESIFPLIRRETTVKEDKKTEA